MRRSSWGIPVVMAATLLLGAGCGTNNDGNNPQSVSTEVVADVDDTASIAATATTDSTDELEPTVSTPAGAVSDDDPTTAPTSTAPNPKPTTTATSKIRMIDATYGHKTPGAEQMTTITYVKCVGEPISGIYFEGASGTNKRPYGDVKLGNYSQDKIVGVTHNILSYPGTYRANIGCGYTKGGNNDWRHEFNLVAAKGGRTNAFVCESGKGCTLNGKRIAFRG